MKKVDVIIIGAGIAGLFLSKLLEKKGIDYLTLERKHKIGTYGPRILAMETINELEIQKEKLIRPIMEINFYSPSGNRLSRKNDEIRGYTSNLEILEWNIFNSLKDKNKILLEQDVLDFDLKNCTVRTDKEDFKFKILVLATGVLGVKFRDRLGISHPKSVFCYAVEIDGVDDEITTILNNDLAKGFYGWIIPLKNNKIEVGFGAEDLNNIGNKAELERRLFRLPYLRKYKNAKKTYTVAGYIPTSIINKKSNSNWIVIGDAAGGEPMMGGSIHKSIDEAKIASEVIEKNLKKKIKSLNIYEKLWEEEFGVEIASQVKIRKMLDSVTNEQLDDVFKKLNGQKIEGVGLINDLFRNIILNIERDYNHENY